MAANDARGLHQYQSNTTHHTLCTMEERRYGMRNQELGPECQHASATARERRPIVPPAPISLLEPKRLPASEITESAGDGHRPSALRTTALHGAVVTVFLSALAFVAWRWVTPAAILRASAVVPELVVRAEGRGPLELLVGPDDQIRVGDPVAVVTSSREEIRRNEVEQTRLRATISAATKRRALVKDRLAVLRADRVGRSEAILGLEVARHEYEAARDGAGIDVTGEREAVNASREVLMSMRDRIDGARMSGAASVHELDDVRFRVCVQNQLFAAAERFHTQSGLLQERVDRLVAAQRALEAAVAKAESPEELVDARTLEQIDVEIATTRCELEALEQWEAERLVSATRDGIVMSVVNATSVEVGGEIAVIMCPREARIAIQADYRTWQMLENQEQAGFRVTRTGQTGILRVRGVQRGVEERDRSLNRVELIQGIADAIDGVFDLRPGEKIEVLP